MDGLTARVVTPPTGQAPSGRTNVIAFVVTMTVSPVQIGAGMEDTMRDPFAGYDAWLERPYQDMIAEADAFYDWCEANDIDPDSDEAESLYADAMEGEYDYDDYEPEDWEYPEEEGW